MELLNSIYQNANMGIVGIDEIMDKIDSKGLYKLIKRHRKGYKSFLKECEKLSNRYRENLKKTGIMARMASLVISEMRLMKSDNDEEIIKMMIEGTYKSMALISTKIFDCDDKIVLNIAKRFIKLLENNINELKSI